MGGGEGGVKEGGQGEDGLEEGERGEGESGGSAGLRCAADKEGRGTAGATGEGRGESR